MTVKTFFSFVRIQTLPVGILPVILGFLFSSYYFGYVNFFRSILFLIGLTAINFFVSAWNNLMDYKKAKDIDYKEKENIIGTKKIPEVLAFKVCFILFLIDILVGIALTILTNLLILPIGAFCLLIAVFYTYGPFAFSRFPLGEILACLIEGVGTFFLAVYVNSYQFNYFNISFSGVNFNINGNLKIIGSIILVGLFCGLLIFNVMLADNVCDLTQDIKNERFTLPSYLGIPRSIKLFKIIYFSVVIIGIIAIVVKILPFYSLVFILAMPLIIQNTNRFATKQSKKETFKFSIQNLKLFELSIILGMIINYFL